MADLVFYYAYICLFLVRQNVVVICFHAVHFAAFLKAVNLSSLYRSEYAVAQTLVFAIQLCYKLLHLFTFCIAVGRAGGFYYRELRL